MRILLAVIDDLFQFARRVISGSFVETPIPSLPRLLPPQREYTPVALSATNRSPAAVLNENINAGSAYFIGSPALLYTDPVIAFDTAFFSISYGEQVQVLKFGGRWAFVRFKNREGWILKDVLKEQARDVLPTIVSGKVYEAHDDEVLKLRLYIEDMYGGAASAAILTDVEYVTYRLLRKGRTIPWGEERPRIAGTWQKNLRGKLYVHSSIVPKTDAVMEYVQDDVGHVGYVEAVFPDDSIKVSILGSSTDGQFEELMMKKDEWKELRPVFIDIQ